MSPSNTFCQEFTSCCSRSAIFWGARIWYLQLVKGLVTLMAKEMYKRHEGSPEICKWMVSTVEDVWIITRDDLLSYEIAPHSVKPGVIADCNVHKQCLSYAIVTIQKRTWRNLGDRAKLASDLTTMLAANLASLATKLAANLASLATMLASLGPS
ncbi:hypothetical protein TNCV_1314761 [Trichonephila clavipes]|uniref:Uncharacterized protein n=1 Tax=Trichonephila clavipes TaxID=2585209 RepID=A0A8X6VDI7_TRICX|nr:hypothetical protein TNCV_1314761 [Trichonephila clavipes]